MRAPLDDYYALLGVARAVSEAELRQAYRVLALQHHPDRAGAASTQRFQQIAHAYRVLQDREARARYDEQLREAEARASGHHGVRVTARPGAPRSPRAATGDGPEHEGGTFVGPGGTVSWTRARGRAAPVELVDRLCGPLEALLAEGVARRLQDGVIELLVSRAEAAAGGTAAIEVRLPVTCPTCHGVAEPNNVWCCRCEYSGTIVDEVTICVRIPPHARDGATYAFSADPAGAAPLRVRLRVA